MVSFHYTNHLGFRCATDFTRDTAEILCSISAASSVAPTPGLFTVHIERGPDERQNLADRLSDEAGCNYCIPILHPAGIELPFFQPAGPATTKVLAVRGDVVNLWTRLELRLCERLDALKGSDEAMICRAKHRWGARLGRCQFVSLRIVVVTVVTFALLHGLQSFKLKRLW